MNRHYDWQHKATHSSTLSWRPYLSMACFVRSNLFMLSTEQSVHSGSVFCDNSVCVLLMQFTQSRTHDTRILTEMGCIALTLLSMHVFWNTDSIREWTNNDLRAIMAFSSAIILWQKTKSYKYTHCVFALASQFLSSLLY